MGVTGAGAAVRDWATAEEVRRSHLEPHLRCATVLASFPRSGSHLVRWYCESAFGWTTLGSQDGEWLSRPPQLHDPPVHVRGRVARPCAPDVVLVKRHGLKDLERFRVMVLLRRDPVEAILSHRRNADDDEFAALVEQDVRGHLRLDRAFARFRGPRLELRYEEFSSDPAQLDQLVAWLGDVDPRLPDPSPVPLPEGRAPMVAPRPAGSTPGDHDSYARSWPERSRLVRDMWSRLAQSEP